jgi:hypothetical protein
VTDAELITLWARKGAAHSNHGAMCEECAFRCGAKGNLCPSTTRDAAEAVAYETATFHCHLGNQHVCTGFLYAKSYFQHKTPTK